MKTAEIRKILQYNFGHAKVIMKRDGDIMVFGVVPNSNDEAWYHYGNVSDEYTLQRVGNIAEITKCVDNKC